MPKFDEEVVREFYANAWPTERKSNELKSKVRGTWISYDRNTINDFLGNPLDLDEGELCKYERIKRGLNFTWFRDNKTAEAMCISGRTFETNQAGKACRILRCNMTTLAQIWTSFLLANIVPLKHSSDLNMARCHIIYCLLKQYEIDVASLISAHIHHFVTQDCTKNPDRSKALGFPSLITTLCAANGVEVNPQVKIRPPIDTRFITKHCTTPHTTVREPIIRREHGQNDLNHILGGTVPSSSATRETYCDNNN